MVAFFTDAFVHHSVSEGNTAAHTNIINMLLIELQYRIIVYTLI